MAWFLRVKVLVLLKVELSTSARPVTPSSLNSSSMILNGFHINTSKDVQGHLLTEK